MTWISSTDVFCLITKKEVHKQFRASMRWIPVIWHHTQGLTLIRLSADRYSAWTRQKTTLCSGHYLRNRSTLDIGVWVISVYLNIRNTLTKSGTFLLGHPVYTARCNTKSSVFCSHSLFGCCVWFLEYTAMVSYLVLTGWFCSLWGSNWIIMRGFSQNCEKRQLVPSCLSLRPHGTTRRPLDGFLLNLVFECFSKICPENSSFIKLWQE